MAKIVVISFMIGLIPVIIGLAIGILFPSAIGHNVDLDFFIILCVIGLFFLSLDIAALILVALVLFAIFIAKETNKLLDDLMDKCAELREIEREAEKTNEQLKDLKAKIWRKKSGFKFYKNRILP